MKSLHDNPQVVKSQQDTLFQFPKCHSTDVKDGATRDTSTVVLPTMLLAPPVEPPLVPLPDYQKTSPDLFCYLQSVKSGQPNYLLTVARSLDGSGRGRVWTEDVIDCLRQHNGWEPRTVKKWLLASAAGPLRLWDWPLVAGCKLKRIKYLEYRTRGQIFTAIEDTLTAEAQNRDQPCFWRPRFKMRQLGPDCYRSYHDWQRDQLLAYLGHTEGIPIGRDKIHKGTGFNRNYQTETLKVYGERNVMVRDVRRDDDLNVLNLQAKMVRSGELSKDKIPYRFFYSKRLRALVQPLGSYYKGSPALDEIPSGYPKRNDLDQPDLASSFYLDSESDIKWYDTPPRFYVVKSKEQVELWDGTIANLWHPGKDSDYLLPLSESTILAATKIAKQA